MLFADRHDAGRRLAERLVERVAWLGPRPIVLALPRGGVPVGFEVATLLSLPLDVFVVRKLGAPGREELAMGAIATGGVVVLGRDVVAALGIDDDEIVHCIDVERQELERRERAFRIGPPPSLGGRGVVLVDDGLATGATMLAAIAALKKLAPARVTVGVPVAAPDICRQVGAEVDEIVCVATPEPFWGVGGWYEDFAQTSDDEVRRLLVAARAQPPAAEAP
jgi:predicted phosphoribosyltransferase